LRSLLSPTVLHRTLLAFLVVALSPVAEARADWLFTPFIGSSFGTSTSYVILETGTATKKLIFGGSAALLSRGVFGVEADFGYASHFFERDNRGGNLTGSNVNTLSGSVLAAVPLSVTRESLRPYIVGGLGLIHAAARPGGTDVFSFDDNFAAYNLGGGAIGLISARTGFRFEIRHFRSVHNAPNALTGEDGPRLGFWRATVGVVIRVAD
jgi:opacity protein-like surface antigen